MTLIAARSTAFSAGDFLARRLIRIGPNYWLFTLFKSALILAAPGAALFSKFSIGQLLTSLAFIPWPEPNRNPVAAVQAPYLLATVILIGWTLTFEMMFYLLYAVARQLFARYWQPVLAAMLVACASLRLIGSENLYVHYFSNPIVIEFAYGIAVGSVFLRGVRPHWPVSAVCVAAGMFLLMCQSHVNETTRFLWLGAPAACLVFGMLMLEDVVPFAKSRCIMAIGASSYSLYILHVNLVPALMLPLRWHVLEHSEIGAVLLLLVALIAQVLAGWIIYRLLEQPMTNGLTAAYKAWQRARVAGPTPMFTET